jgi:hypothetical protein
LFDGLVCVTLKPAEESELLWDDGVAPELCIDFDAPWYSRSEGLMWWLAGFGFFAGLATVISSTDPAGQKRTVPPNTYIFRSLYFTDTENSELAFFLFVSRRLGSFLLTTSDWSSADPKPKRTKNKFSADQISRINVFTEFVQCLRIIIMRFFVVISIVTNR